jgi:hypothetical protein
MLTEDLGLMKCSHSREAQRGRTRTEFTSKLQVSLAEADETLHWAASFLNEANELTSILVTSVRSAESKR